MTTTATDNGASDTAPGQLRIDPPTRQRVADHVFETLLKAILRGEIKPGDPLPTQRELASRFNISPLVVRQAIHRLEDLSLVRVRQGSSTIVLDPAKAGDIRLVQLQFEMSDPGPLLAAAAAENQALFLVPLLALAQRRITKEELGVLDYLVGQMEAQTGAEPIERLRVEYWGCIARATRNPLFQQQVRWWLTLMSQVDRRTVFAARPPQDVMVDVYRKVNAALARGTGAVELWLQLVEPVLNRFDAQREKADRALTRAGSEDPSDASPKALESSAAAHDEP